MVSVGCLLLRLLRWGERWLCRRYRARVAVLLLSDGAAVYMRIKSSLAMKSCARFTASSETTTPGPPTTTSYSQHHQTQTQTHRAYRLVPRALSHTPNTMSATLPFRDINVHASSTYYAFSSPSSPNAPTLVVDRPSGDLRLNDGKLIGGNRVSSVSGILGIIKLRLGTVLSSWRCTAAC